MNDVRITHIGGPTALIEVGGWRLLTDPTFDPPGRRYFFGWGTRSRKLTGPAVDPADLPPIDAVLLSHDHHGDNLDDACRSLLPGAGSVLTTVSGAGRLAGNAVGLRPWEVTTLAAPDRPTIEVTATPARHGPPGTRLLVGDAIGFALRWEGQKHGALWISGDTVLYGDVREIGDRIGIGTALLHLGGVWFPITGPLHYTMTAEKGVELCEQLKPHTVLPIHYEGWQHFRQSRGTIAAAFAAGPAGVRDSLQWLPHGTPTEVDV